jgi:hypothetical protein
MEKYRYPPVHCKKRLAILPSSARMSLAKLSLAGNNSAGDVKIANLFCNVFYFRTFMVNPPTGQFCIFLPPHGT